MECPIRYDELDNPLDMWMTAYSHSFNRSCLRGWLVHHTSCPLCRGFIPMESVMPTIRIIYNNDRRTVSFTSKHDFEDFMNEQGAGWGGDDDNDSYFPNLDDYDEDNYQSWIDEPSIDPPSPEQELLPEMTVTSLTGTPVNSSTANTMTTNDDVIYEGTMLKYSDMETDEEKVYVVALILRDE